MFAEKNLSYLVLIGKDPHTKYFVFGINVMANLIILNPNTDASLTQRLVRKGEALWSGGTVRGVTALVGEAYITSRVSYVRAEYAVLELFERLVVDSQDKIFVACFGDPAVKALRELTSVPVIGMASASLSACRKKENGIGIVTGGFPWKVMIEEFLRAEQLESQVVGVAVTEENGGVAFRKKEMLVCSIVDVANFLITHKKATSILIAGAGFSGLKKDIVSLLSVPVYCSYEESILFLNEFL